MVIARITFVPLARLIRSLIEKLPGVASPADNGRACSTDT